MDGVLLLHDTLRGAETKKLLVLKIDFEKFHEKVKANFLLH